MSNSAGMDLQRVPLPKPSLLEFARRIPKVELHAHLHGCIRPATVRDLASARGIILSPEQQRVLAPGGERSLSDCFKIFDTIHTVVSDLPAVRRITLEALQDMQRDNVRYAELRTTPRPLADGTSRRDYIENVLQVFQEFEASQATKAIPSLLGNTGRIPESGNLTDESLVAGTLTPRLLLSVDRTKSVEEAMEVAKLAVELRGEEEWRPYVLGMDFSGNPTKGSFKEFRLAFESARSNGLKVTVHCGEVPNDTDFLEVIAFRPERLGHAVVLGEEVRQMLLSLVPRIPIEVCPTSNLLTLALSHHGEHPTVQGWIEAGYPFGVNTDDSGVFDTDLATEFAHLATSNDLDEEGIACLACRAVQDIFDDGLRPSLAESFRRECDVLLASSSSFGEDVQKVQ
ncbi:conserved unknown protein [Ectocarpus siliculosus]|uniref:Adenosine deaminase domain-containing protein n=1 Tax=Ectocarpus siliculosus TaxID=2880 RepID=D7G826_ECTSI|nr:conserved unknown protein [Ectocarpus siliculosus]|eukprot:CBJ34009.1 conserved unknown protein [Ectocarpus siliculosus]